MNPLYAYVLLLINNETYKHLLVEFQISVSNIIENTIEICDSRLKDSISSSEVILSLQLYSAMLDTSFAQLPSKKLLRLPLLLIPSLVSTHNPQFMSGCDALRSLLRALQLYPNSDLIPTICDLLIQLFQPFLSRFLVHFVPLTHTSSSCLLSMQLELSKGSAFVARGCLRTLSMLFEFFQDTMRDAIPQLVELITKCVGYRETFVLTEITCTGF